MGRRGQSRRTEDGGSESGEGECERSGLHQSCLMLSRLSDVRVRACKKSERQGERRSAAAANLAAARRLGQPVPRLLPSCRAPRHRGSLGNLRTASPDSRSLYRL